MPHDSASVNQDSALCTLCSRNFSKYTCPTCNTPYCSLTCYRSRAHSQCTEVFYRRELENEYRIEPSRTIEEKRKMMDLLKRFEEQAGDLEADNLHELESDGDDGDDGDDEDDSTSTLAERLKNVNVGDASAEDLWSALSPVQQKAFLKAVNDPSSTQTQELLRSELLLSNLVLPWWEAPLVAGDNSPTKGLSPINKRYGTPPTIISIPSSLQQAALKSRSLIHNLFAISLAYAQVTRHLAFSPLCTLPDPNDAEIVRDTLSSIVPFMTERKSSVLHTGVDSAFTDVASRLSKPSAAQLHTLLQDSVKLLDVARVKEIDVDTEGNAVDSIGRSPYQNAILMLCDLHALFAGQRKLEHVQHKLAFYTAYVSTLDYTALSLLRKVISMKATEMTSSVELESKRPQSALEVGDKLLDRRKTSTRIEEL